MFKKIVVLALGIQVIACTPADVNKVLSTASSVLNEPTAAEMGMGLKEALNLGIAKGADVLSARDGFYKSAYKIMLPQEAQQLTNKLKNIPGFNQVEDIVLERVNHAAEDAATKAKPIFMDAIKQMSFQDAAGILLGNNNAATQYLQKTTNDKLYAEFSPIIVNSLNKFNALNYWTDAVNAYNKIPLVQKMNPKLEDYVTQQALKSLFSMVEQKEKDIRSIKAERTSELLKKVFAKQDKN